VQDPVSPPEVLRSPIDAERRLDGREEILRAGAEGEAFEAVIFPADAETFR
jgi:hypothetical protein